MKVCYTKKYMQRNFSNLMILALLIIFLLTTACTTTEGVGGSFITGSSWKHPNKPIQEQQQDLIDCRNGCEQSVRAKGYSGDFAIFHMRDCEDKCMLDKGYKWH
jgi:predicted small secreted protein